MSNGKTELFASPQDVQRRAATLLNRWNALINQAVGPSARGRSDVPQKLQAQLVSDLARYRKLLDDPLFGFYGVLAPQSLEDTKSSYSLLKRWYAKYRLRAQQVQAALPKGEALSKGAAPKSMPRQRSAVENLERAATTGKLLLIGAASVLAVLAALAIARRV